MPILNTLKSSIKVKWKSHWDENTVLQDEKATQLLYPTNFFSMNFGNFPTDSLLNSSFFMPVLNFLGILWPDRSSTVCSFEDKGPTRKRIFVKKVNQNQKILFRFQIISYLILRQPNMWRYPSFSFHTTCKTKFKSTGS